MVWCGLVMRCVVWFGDVWCGLVWCDVLCCAVMRCGVVWGGLGTNMARGELGKVRYLLHGLGFVPRMRRLWTNL